MNKSRFCKYLFLHISRLCRLKNEMDVSNHLFLWRQSVNGTTVIARGDKNCIYESVSVAAKCIQQKFTEQVPVVRIQATDLQEPERYASIPVMIDDGTLSPEKLFKQNWEIGTGVLIIDDVQNLSDKGLLATLCQTHRLPNDTYIGSRWKIILTAPLKMRTKRLCSKLKYVVVADILDDNHSSESIKTWLLSEPKRGTKQDLQRYKEICDILATQNNLQPKDLRHLQEQKESLEFDYDWWDKLIDESGEEVTLDTYNHIIDFQEGRHLYGLKNIFGELLIPPIYDEIRQIGTVILSLAPEQVYIVRKEGKLGLVKGDGKGTPITAFQYKDITYVNKTTPPYYTLYLDDDTTEYVYV